MRFSYDLVLPLLLVIAALSVALIAIDIEHLRLPNAVVLPMLVFTLLYLLMVSYAEQDFSQLISAMQGSALYLGFFVILYVVTSGRGIGLGDVKLAPALGLMTGWFGFGSSIVGLFAAFGLGGLWAIYGLVRGTMNRKSALPFGPMLIIAAWLAVFYGAELWGRYVALTGLT